MPENLNLKTVDTVDTRPFRKLVMTIGELPSAFVESMTYYELLAWFVNYLETVIIPTVNNNAEAVEELQDNFVELKNDTETEISRFETELTAAFNQLKDFVDNYFDNLDVQDEIDNKLDEMAEAGTLQEIITQYINSTALWMFDNLAGLKAATNLVNGSYAKTLGYTTKNDEGGAWYKIRTKTNDDTTNEKTLIALTDTTLVAELCITNSMNVKQFGAKGDGTTDDTNSIQLCVNNCDNVNVPEGTYMVDAETHINLRSGNKLELDNSAVIKAITNDANTYTVLLVDNCEDVEICGGTIEGDRETHTGETGEWGHCIRLWGTSTRIYIHDINLINAWGDGIDCDITGSAVTARVHVDNVRRNGFSITKADSFISNDDFIENTNGTNPQSGVDIEPNDGSDILRNIEFNNLRTKNNSAYGIVMALNGGNETSNYTNITINNLRSENDTRGIGIRPEAGRLGEIIINEPLILGTKGVGSILVDTQSEMPIRIIRPTIKYYAVNAVGDSGILIQGTIPQNASAVGNVDVINAVVTDPVTPPESSVVNTWAITVRSDASNVHIIDPINLDGKLVRLGMRPGNSIKDEFKLFERDIDANFTISADGMWMSATSSNYTANRFINIRGDQNYPIGTKFNFVNTGDYKMEIRFPDNYVYPISSTTGSSVYLREKGASMTIQRITSDSWAIVSQNGNIGLTSS